MFLTVKRTSLLLQIVIRLNFFATSSTDRFAKQSWDLYYKTFYSRNLWIFAIS
jgi:hypothetical protein